MGTIAVLGGFERSGHDAAAESLVAAAKSIGISVTELRWRDLIDLEDLLLFHLHRTGSAPARQSYEALTTDPQLQDAIVSDLRRYLPDVVGGSDSVVSTHPWSTRIAATCLAKDSFIVDAHVEFTPFPVQFFEGVDLYTGAWMPHRVRASYSRRLLPIGIPVRRSFSPGEQKIPGSLAVNCGAGGWFAETAVDYLPVIQRSPRVGSVTLLLAAPNEALVARALSVCTDADVNVVSGLSDVGHVVSKSEFILTKAGGAPVAEALAAGCLPVLIPSGVSWEDDAMMRLAYHGVAVTASEFAQGVDRSRSGAALADELGARIRDAAGTIIQLANERQTAAGQRQPWIVGELRDRAEHDARSGILPSATRRLLELIREEDHDVSP